MSRKSTNLRIAFSLGEFGQSWLGGVNYFRSLFFAIAVQERRKVETVLFVAPGMSAEARRCFPEVGEIVETRLIVKRGMPFIVRRLIEKATGTDFLMRRLLRRRRIDLISHDHQLGRNSCPHSIVWIPDFQHVHLPHLFSKREIFLRSQYYRKTSSLAERVVLSSDAARRDAEAFMPELVSKMRTLHFSPKIEFRQVVPLPELQQRYHFTGPYLFLPNQFWVHKNHLTVIKALGCLKRDGLDVLVISTGGHSDSRNPRHCQDIMEAVEANGINDLFLMLGVIPYEDMAALMYHSRAVLNPSLFEGWSTTVEEAKILGKLMVLSDLPVHREQAGETALYFEALSEVQCAEALKTAWSASVPAVDFLELKGKMLRAAKSFGARYLEIVGEILPEKEAPPLE